MSIAEKIQELQKIQAKITLYRNLADSVEGLVEGFACTDLEVQETFVEELRKFAIRMANRLDGHEETPVQQPKAPEAAPKDDPAPKERGTLPQDPLRFAMHWRKFESKEVTVRTGGSETFVGVVRGVSPPNVVIEAPGGQTITVPPSDIDIGGIE